MALFWRIVLCGVSLFTAGVDAAASPIKVPEKCLSKTDLFGTATADSRPFDHTDFLTRNMPVNILLSYYNACTNDEDRLNSVMWTGADVEMTGKIYFPRIGPRVGTCNSWAL